MPSPEKDSSCPGLKGLQTAPGSVRHDGVGKRTPKKGRSCRKNSTEGSASELPVPQVSHRCAVFSHVGTAVCFFRSLPPTAQTPPFVGWKSAIDVAGREQKEQGTKDPTPGHPCKPMLPRRKKKKKTTQKKVRPHERNTNRQRRNHKYNYSDRLRAWLSSGVPTAVYRPFTTAAHTRGVLCRVVTCRTPGGSRDLETCGSTPAPPAPTA